MLQTVESFQVGRPFNDALVVPTLFLGVWYNPPPFGKKLFVSRFQEPPIDQHGGALIIF